uniref:RING-type domain-containing protein n=2 Tax=Rhizophagus irregularis (strain DAOM 181602 / DAOM 197198 / MUCL 43194) TaxID=747089 RepID=U9URN5_RHIID
MENQDSSVNTEVTTVDEINIGPIGNTQSREKSSISESERPSLVNLKNLGYNILKSLDDETVGDIDFPELDSCPECGNDILMSPLKAFSYLACGHIFHRLCIKKKLFIGTSSACPAPDCGKSVDILDQADGLTIISDLPIPDSRVTSQSSGISPLSNLMGTFTLSSPPIRMGGIKGTATQQVKSTLRCAKCSEDFSSYLPPLGFLRISPQPQGPPKPLVYLTCMHIVHYSCIDNPRKLCPICPSTNDTETADMETDNDEIVTDNFETQGSRTTQNKRTMNPASTEQSSSKKAKQIRKQIDRNDSPTLKKLIMELTSPESLEDGLSRDPLITLQSSVSEMDVNLLDFLDLYNKIGTAEDNL